MMQRQVGLPAPSYPLGCVCQIKLERRSNGKFFLEERQPLAYLSNTENGFIRFQMTTDGDVGRNAEEVLRVLQAFNQAGNVRLMGNQTKNEEDGTYAKKNKCD
jgi:peroxiredoxin 2/4